MSLTQNNAVCPAILVGIEEIMNTNAPAGLITPIGAIQALFDPANRQPNTVVQTVNAELGHPKTVRIKRKQRATKDDTTTTKDCEPGTEKPYFEDVFTVNQYRQHVIHVTEATVRRLCDAYSKYVTVPVKSRDTDGTAIANKQIMREIVDELMMDFDALRLAINDDILASMALNFGTFVGGDASKTYTVRRGADAAAGGIGSPVLDGFTKMKQDLARTTFGGTPIIFGEGIFDLANEALKYGCCNSGGTNFGEMAGNPGFKYYKDFAAGAAFGDANAAGIFLPGAMQFASYNEYVADFARPIGVMSRGTMPDPKIPGLVYDMRFLPNECGEYYDLFIELYFDLYTAPTNLFKTGDRLDGVNGFFKAIFAATA